VLLGGAVVPRPRRAKGRTLCLEFGLGLGAGWPSRLSRIPPPTHVPSPCPFRISFLIQRRNS